MFRLAVILSVLVLFNAAVEPNRVASGNNRLISTLNWIDNNLVHSYSDSNKQKRAFSVIAEATLLYITQPIDTHGVIRKMHELLTEPSDIIAADPSKDLAYVKSLIAQPVNDIKRACRPDTKAMACVDILEYHYRQQEARCSEYHNHVELRDNLVKLIDDDNFKQYLRGAITESRRGNDIFAISYFLEHQVLFEDVFDKLRDMYRELIGKKYPCRFFGAYDSDDQGK